MKKLLCTVLCIFIIFLNGCIEKKEKLDYKSQYINYGILDFPKELTLFNSEDISYKDILMSLFEGLVTLDEEGNIKEGLIKSYNVNKEKTLYSFKLREDAKWSDGSKISAKDVTDFFKMVLEDKEENFYSYRLDCIFGAKDFREGKIPFEKVAINVIDEENIEIRMNYPCSNFLYIISDPVFSIRKDREDLKNWSNSFNKIKFSGPYVIESFKNNILKLSPNKYYFDKSINNKGVQFVKENTSEIILSKLENSKEIDLMRNPPISEINRIYAMELLGKSDSYYINTIIRKGNILTSIVFNNKNKYIDKNLKKLFYYAINKEEIIKEINNNLGVEAFSIINKYKDESKAVVSNKNNALEGKKEEILKFINEDINIKDKKLKFVYNDSNYNKKVIEQIKKQLKLINKEEALISIDYIPYDSISYKEAIDKGEYDILLIDNTINYMDELEYFKRWTSSSSLNVSSYKNWNYDLKLFSAIKETENTKKEEYTKICEDILIEDMVYIPLFFNKDVICHLKDIKDVKVNKNGNLILKEMYKSSS